MSSQSSHHPQEVLLAQFSLYVHKGGLKPDLFHFNSSRYHYKVDFAVSSVARFCSKPEQQHWTAVKRIMRYLNGTINLGLLYSIKSSED